MTDWLNEIPSAYFRGVDWASSPLGPVEQWSDRLRAQVELVLTAHQPMYIAVGPDLTFIHNDAYRSVIRGMAQNVNGQPMRRIFADIWPELETMFARVMAGHPEVIENFQISTPWRADRPQGRFSFSLVPIRDEAGGVSGLIASVFETSDQMEMEARLRETEEQQAFMLRFSDALRAETDADAVAYCGLRMISAQLGLDRAYLASYRLAENRADITHQVGTEGVPPMPDMIQLSDFPLAFRQVLDKTLIVEDVAATPGLSDLDRQNMQALGFGALVAPTLRRGEGKPLWVLVAVSKRPRRWTPGEILLLEETTERLWTAMKRAASDTALQGSEERFRQFANASSGALWIRNATTLEMEYASPAIQQIYGVPAEDILGDVRHWAAMIVPEDRDGALQHIAEAQQGNVVNHEFRIRRPDGTFRWIRNADFPLFDSEGRIERVGGIAEDVTETKRSEEHRGVLLHELQHRVRNIMGVIRSLANRTADGPADVEDYRQRLEGRLLALARVQTLLTREANAGGSLRHLLETEVHAQAHHPGQLEVVGTDIVVSPKAVEVLTLAFHELATNALKYGALSVPDGLVSVTWRTIEKAGAPWLVLDWTETRAPSRPPSLRRGFGSELIEARIPYELRGKGRVTITSEGARCHLEFPLNGAESILETDAPVPTTIFGGSLDMSGAPDLRGRKILVVEDDFYLAADAAAALRGAGAEVLGPCPREDETLHLLERETPDMAVVDLNLGGGGPRFEVARSLRAKNIPFVFFTGSDPDLTPGEFAGVLQFQKPIPLREVVEAVARL